MAVTDRNVDGLVATGVLWAGSGFPTLAARLWGELVGWVLWGPMPEAWESVYHGTMWGLGSYTLPEHRSSGIAEELRQEAFRRTAVLGFQRMIGLVWVRNGKGIEHFQAANGAEVVAVMIQKEV